jgi:hypothetical protein
VGETEAVQQELSISNQELAASRKQLAKLDETSRDEIEGLQASMRMRMCMHTHTHVVHAHAHVHAIPTYMHICIHTRICICMYHIS